MKGSKCWNCQGKNAKVGYVELWDGKCPECGRQVEPAPLDQEASQ
jgi:Zn finger protein HypA/HybF involved in hydrogenase expression